jgi:hypothetical protein
MEAASETIKTVERPPRSHVDSKPLPTDSMVTVPLSEAATDEDNLSPRLPQPEILVDEEHLSSRPSSSEIMTAFGHHSSQDDTTPTAASPTISLQDADSPETQKEKARGRRSNSIDSSQSAHVDWAELEKKEEQEPQEDGRDGVS